MMRRVCFVVMYAVLCVAGSASPVSSPAPVESPQLAPCVAEDSAGPCVWDAESRGNGRGVSFIRDAAGAVTREPYGGCDEAGMFPDSAGAAWCAEAGLS